MERSIKYVLYCIVYWPTCNQGGNKGGNSYPTDSLDASQFTSAPLSLRNERLLAVFSRKISSQLLSEVADAFRRLLTGTY